MKQARAAEAAANGALDAMATKLAAAEAEIRRLNETPDAVYSAISNAIAAATSAAGADAVEDEIEAFSKRFVGQLRPVRELTLRLKARRKAIAKEQVETEKARKAAAWDAAVAAMQQKVSSADDESVVDFEAVMAAMLFILDMVEKTEELPATSFGQAMKDIDGAQGRFIDVRGTIAQIVKRDDFGYFGLLCVGFACRQAITFIAANDADLVEGRRGHLVGIVTQRFSYPNAAGGTTHSIVVSGVLSR